MVTVAEWAMLSVGILLSVGIACVLAVLFSTRHDDSLTISRLTADYELKLELQRIRNEFQTR